MGRAVVAPPREPIAARAFPDALFVVTAEGRIAQWDVDSQRLFGVPREAIEGRTLADVFTTTKDRALRTLLVLVSGALVGKRRDQLAQGTSHAAELRVLEDDEHRVFAYDLVPVCKEVGELDTIVCRVREVTGAGGGARPDPELAVHRAIIAAADQAGLGFAIVTETTSGPELSFVNDAGRRILGDGPVGDGSPLAWIAPEDRARLLALRERSRRGERVSPFIQTTLVRTDGARVPVEVGIGAGRFRGRDATFCLFRDVSQDRSTISALRESERRLTTIIQAAPIVLFALDREGRFTLSEGKGLEAAGRRTGESVGQSVFEIYKDLPRVGANVRRALAGEVVRDTLEARGRWWDVTYSPLSDDAGDPAGVIGVAADVTERETLRARLEARLFVLERVMEHLGEGVVVCRDDRVVLANPAARRMLRETQPALLKGRRVTDLFDAAERDRIHLLLDQARVASEAGPLDVKLANSRRGRKVSLVAAPVPEADGTAVLLILRPPDKGDAGAGRKKR